MYYYKIDISYDGTKYNGWQRQNNTSDTIQSKIEKALSAILGVTTEIDGAGRTDAGVHAKHQTASFCVNNPLDCDSLLQKLAKILPHDIAINSVIAMPERFHARLNARGKIYQYRIYTRPESPVFERNYCFHHSDKLDSAIMRTIAECFVGTHDFKLYQDNRHIKKSTIRTIYDISIEENNGFIDITFKGDGFMYHMIRHIVGIMIYYAKTRETIPADFFSLTERHKKWPLAPAKGLTLISVIYD